MLPTTTDTPAAVRNAPSHSPATAAGLATGVVLIATAAIVYAALEFSNGWQVIAGIVFMTAMLAALGRAIVGHAWGALISEHNVVSLSRWQMAVWTIVVLSGYIAYVFARLRAGQTDPLAIEIDWRVWALLGMSTTSLVGAAAIVTTKNNEVPAAKATARTAAALNQTEQEVDENRQGLLFANPSMADAAFTDIFQGDEVANAAHVDFAKVQMFYFTVAGAVAMVAVIVKHLRAGDLDHFPALSEGFLTILGISHAGYLGGKVITKTPLAEGEKA